MKSIVVDSMDFAKGHKRASRDVNEHLQAPVF